MNTGTQYTQLTVGDLIVAVTDAALEVTQDEEIAYEIAGVVLMRLLSACTPATAEYLLTASGSTTVH